MIHNIFSLPIYKINVLHSINNLDEIKQFIGGKLSQSQKYPSPLEKQGGSSTYASDPYLHKSPILAKLNSLVVDHCKVYWKILDIDNRLSPRIDQCWSNIHYKQSLTLQHSHSLMPMVATFYLEAYENSGNLILINPMEYSLTHIPYCVPIENKTEVIIPISTGDLVLFPGWVRHKTETNLSDHERIVISYNIGYDGKYLDSEVDYPLVTDRVSENSEISLLNNKIERLEFIIENFKKNVNA